MNEAIPLDIDLNSIDTDFPLIGNGEIVDMRVDKIEPKKSKANSPMLSIEFVTVSPSRSHKGDELAPGVRVFHNINLEPTGKATSQMVLQNIAQYTKAIGFSGTYGQFKDGGYQSTLGAQCRAKIAYIPEGPDKSGVVRRAKNEVSVFMKA